MSLNNHVIASLAVILLIITGYAVLLHDARTNAGKAQIAVSVPESTSSLPLRSLHEQGATARIFGRNLIAAKTGETITYYFQDTISNNRISTNAEGTITNKGAVYPFGKTLSEGKTSTDDTRYRFTGKERDGSLDYFGARYYSSRTGRFISTDPIPDLMSSYKYADNNPLIKIDPTGMLTIKTAQEFNEILSRNSETDQLVDFAYQQSDSLTVSLDKQVLEELLGTSLKGTKAGQVAENLKENFISLDLTPTSFSFRFKDETNIDLPGIPGIDLQLPKEFSASIIHRSTFEHAMGDTTNQKTGIVARIDQGRLKIVGGNIPGSALKATVGRLKDKPPIDKARWLLSIHGEYTQIFLINEKGQLIQDAIRDKKMHSLEFDKLPKDYQEEYSTLVGTVVTDFVAQKEQQKTNH